MSSRVLKKLHGENDFDLREQDEQLSDIEVEFRSGAKKKQLNLNRYDLLNQQSPSESEVKEDDNETEHASAANNASVCNLSKKKKKKRKKKSTKTSVQRRSSEDNADIDELVRTVSDFDREKGPDTYAKNVIPKTLLTIQTKHLNPQFEMRRTFGCRVVQAEHQVKRRNMRGQRPILKSTWLVTARDTWPAVSKTGIYMEIVKPTEDCESSSITWFKFEHNTSYRVLQQMFLSAVESSDSENIIRIISRQPYHVDSLIQMSELCKITEDHAMASVLIERALLALETAFHTMFSITSGNCRLDYRIQENRAFFIVLFKHAQYLEERACSRTALEFAKLILSLDPDTDPLAMILVIDYYALRSKQYEWLVQFYNEWNPIKNLSQLPNMAYSYALSLFYVQGDAEEANTAIQYALLMFPSLLKPLLEALSIQTDARVTTHSFFNCESSQPIALQQLIALYLCRSKLMWRDTIILPWLEKNVSIILDKVDRKDEIVSEYNRKRSQRYMNPPRPILRHIFLSDYKEKVPLANFISKEKDPIVLYDPLPPLDAVNIYDNKPPSDRPNQSSDTPISLFLQSILPSYNMSAERRGVQMNWPDEVNVNQENAIAMEEGAAALVREPYRDFRNSVTSIVEAMRGFLSNVRVPERPNDADVDENESSEDETTGHLT